MASTAPQAQMIRLQDVRAAMASAEELRALHAAIHNLPPPPLKLSRPAQLPPEDYPVFTPSYGDPLARYLPPRSSQSLPPSEISVSIEEPPQSKSQPLPETHTHKGALFSRLLLPLFRRKTETKESPNNNAMDELRSKLASLESHCDELKTALKTSSNLELTENHQNFPVIVSEARHSVRQFCKLIISHAEETLPSSSTRRSKLFLLRLEAVVNRVFYEDFENVRYERAGSPRALNPVQNQAECLAAFQALRDGKKADDDGLDCFRRHKMAALAAALGWSTPWAGRMTRGCHVAATCVWMVHLLAFSFGPPIRIFRVNEGRRFDPVYMEDALPQKSIVN